MPQEKKCTAKRKRITLVMFSAGMESAGMDPTVMDSSDLTPQSTTAQSRQPCHAVAE